MNCWNTTTDQLCNRNLQENQGLSALVLREWCVSSAVADHCTASFLGCTLWYTCTVGSLHCRNTQVAWITSVFALICTPVAKCLTSFAHRASAYEIVPPLPHSLLLTAACLRWSWAQHYSLAAASLLMDIMEALGWLPHSEIEHGNLSTDNTLFKWQLLECFLASHFNSITSVNSNIEFYSLGAQWFCNLNVPKTFNHTIVFVQFCSWHWVAETAELTPLATTAHVHNPTVTTTWQAGTYATRSWAHPWLTTTDQPGKKGSRW